MIASLLNVEGLMFIMRWLHFFFGVVWIGHLYYFNFVQGAFFNETDASTKSNAIQKLVPRALWWFRYGALWTFLTGLIILSYKGHQLGPDFLNTSYGLNILIGSTLGILMAANVWFVIWPNQKIVIQSATQAAQGGQALPNAAAAGAKAGLASRHNVLFSLPMLFFMGAASHLQYQVTSAGAFLGLSMVVIAALEFNALKGKMGPLATVKGVIHCGVALTALFVAFAAITQ
ncbi:MAG: urate hydroxylase PuuD [Bdellovibrionales bacterium]